jgi:protein SCO1/2
VNPARLLPLLAAAALALLVSASAVDARAQQWRESSDGMANTPAPELEGVGIVEHLKGQLPADAAFRDAEGKPVHLGDYFDHKRPTLLVFAYHTCPMLCSLVLDATVRSLNEVQWTVGREFDVVSISIDPKDTPETATRKRGQVVNSYVRARGDTTGWHFLVGDEPNIAKVTEAVGFEYRYDARQKQYAHPAAVYLLTPDGKMARYLYGIQYDPKDIRLGLLEATEGRSVTTTERILLYCYHYDPQGKHYSIVAMNVMRLGGAVTLVVFGSFLGIMWLRERRKKKSAAPSALADKPRPTPVAAVTSASASAAVLGPTPRNHHTS